MKNAMEERTIPERTAPGIMLAAVKSGSGKTTLTCALLRALKDRGLAPCAFKCGPDYIDPMFHREVIGVLSRNLDPFFSEEGQLRDIYLETERDRGIAVVEGAMGLFDGLGGISEAGSAYQVACALDLPILLVVDARGMGRSIVPLLSGFLQYDREKRIAGVILNKTSEQFFRKISAVIEGELNLPALGFLPCRREFEVESRHLGLRLPAEIGELKERLGTAAKTLEQCADVDRILEIAGRGGRFERYDQPGLADRVGRTGRADERGPAGKGMPLEEGRVRIGVARDEAFCFYYEENLRLLEEKGARLVSFSPLHDERLPEDLDGILLGGGYPELYAAQLENNVSMRASVRQAIGRGLPSLAECGGFLYLHETLRDRSGREYAMCGALPGKCFDTGKLVRFGYVELAEQSPIFWKEGAAIKGHEFHYYESENNGGDCLAKKPLTGAQWRCAHETKRSFWGFAHLYYPSNPDFASHWIEEARLYRKERGADRLE